MRLPVRPAFAVKQASAVAVLGEETLGNQATGTKGGRRVLQFPTSGVPR